MYLFRSTSPLFTLPTYSSRRTELLNFCVFFVSIKNCSTGKRDALWFEKIHRGEGLRHRARRVLRRYVSLTLNSVKRLHVIRMIKTSARSCRGVTFVLPPRSPYSGTHIVRLYPSPGTNRVYAYLIVERCDLVYVL